MTAQRITRGFAWNHLYKLVEYGGVNLYIIMVVRHFGPEVGGSYAVYLSISGILAIVGAFAVDGVLLRYLPRILGGERNYGGVDIKGIRPFLIELLAFRLFVNLCLAALLVIVLVILPNYSSALAVSLNGIRQLWMYFVIFLIAQAAVAFSTNTLIGLLQTKWVFFASLIIRFSLLAGGVALLMMGRLSLNSAVALHAFAAVASAILLLYWVHRNVEHTSSDGLRLEVANFRRHLAGFIRRPRRVRIFLLMPFMLYGITTWGSDVLSTVLGRQPDILMMRTLLGENAKDIGLYEAATRLGLMTEYVFLFGLGGTLVSVFSEFAHSDERKARELEPDLESNLGVRRKLPYPRLSKARYDVAGYQAVSTAPLFVFMIAFTPLVIEVVYGHRFTGAAPMFLATLILQALTVISFGGGMHITSLVAIGRERAVFVNRLVWGILNLIGNYFLILHWGGLGAIIGTQTANLGAVITESVIAARLIGQCLQFVRTAAIASIVFVAAIVTYYGVSWMPTEVPSIARLAAAAIVMALLTIIGYAVFRVPEARKAWGKIRSLTGRPETPSLSV